MEEQNQFLILIVDDTKENIETLIALLEDDYALVVAKNGEAAIKKALKTQPDLILLDIMMPGMDGFEVCRRLKADEKTIQIPVIFISALSDAKDEAEGFKIGAVDYITKPFRPVVVKERIKTHLSLKEYQTQLQEMVRQRTQQLEQAKVAAQSANKAKSDFLMNMSHELRTPLNGIAASSELMASCDQQVERNKLNDTIQSSTNALENSVASILEFTRSKDGELELEHFPFRLDQALSKLKTRFFYKGQYLDLQLAFTPFPLDLPNALIGDDARLVEILNNLLENAAKFTAQEPKVHLSISITNASEAAVELKFLLKDDGIGVAKEYLTAIFEPFFQVDSSSTRQYDGMGMGLATCQQLCELMKGKIGVKSEPGKGSSFHFTVVFDRQKVNLPFDVQKLQFLSLTCETEKQPLKNIDPKILIPLFNSLANGLSTFNPQEVKTYFLKLEQYDLPQIEQIVTAIDDYEYDEALTILKAIAAEIDMEL